MRENQPPALEVRQLSVQMKEGGRLLPVVHQASIQVARGGCTGLIGESGCGKSISCQALLGLLEPKKWTVEAQVRLAGEAVPLADDRAMDAFRGRRMALVSQNPMAAFDPRRSIGAHFCLGYPRREKKARLAAAREQLARMYIQEPDAVLKSYPFQLSGGMLQRILIALALSSRPALLIADEPTTALDSTTQSEILRILTQCQEETGVSLLLVSHDLEVISQMADAVYVMYAGTVVEYGSKELVLRHPLHPYTRGLFRSRPAFSKARLTAMEGRPPRLGEAVGTQCPFAARCAFAGARCREMPPLLEREPGHFSRCMEGEYGTAFGSTTTA